MFKYTAIAAVLLAGISCGSTASPTSPSSSNATATTLTLTAAAPAGAGFQLNARAGLSDGTSQDVTAQTVFESGNPQLATVSANGLVTVLGAGEVDFRATYLTLAASLHASVVQSRYTLSGRLTSVYPNLPQYLSGATVEITAGPNAGLSATTDANGRYAISGLSSGSINMRASMAGFSNWSLSHLPITANTSIDPVLFPTPPVNASGVSATAQCNDATWTWTQTVDRACSLHSGVAWGVCPGPLCDSIGNIR